MKLSAHRYGKSRVRLLKVLREGARHTVKELTARVLLEGAFERSYTDADNVLVVATDTMKNTLNVLAHAHLGAENEPFARTVAAHFLDRYPQVSRLTVELDERVWTRLRDHPHSFTQAEVARPFTRLIATRRAAADAIGAGAPTAQAGLTPHDTQAPQDPHEAIIHHESGVRDLTILKSTGSGFERFARDEWTTLADTQERLLATTLRATWVWAGEAERQPASHRDAARLIVDALLGPFAERYSPSVQATLFEMGSAALAACPAIDRITLAMPNLHCLPIDLTPFGRANRHELFVPIDEPHGDIEATITR